MEKYIFKFLIEKNFIGQLNALYIFYIKYFQKSLVKGHWVTADPPCIVNMGTWSENTFCWGLTFSMLVFLKQSAEQLKEVGQ